MEAKERNKHGGQRSVRRERAKFRRKSRRDSRSHRKLTIRKGDKFSFRGMEMTFIGGTGKLTADVLTPEPYRHVFAAKLEERS
jgi:hypothetical protein